MKTAWTVLLLIASAVAEAQQVRPHEEVEPGRLPDPSPSAAEVSVDAVDLPPTLGAITLKWTAPLDLDNELNAQAAAAYRIRWSTAGPILDESAWNGASPAPEADSMTPKDPGTPEGVTIQLPAPGTLYYFALKSKDPITSSWSPLSNSPEGTTIALVIPPPPSPTPKPSTPSDPEGSDGGGRCQSSSGASMSLRLVTAIGLMTAGLYFRRFP